MTSLRADDRLFEAEVLESHAPGVHPPAGRDKTFRPYDQHQRFLLPPSLDDWLPAGHTARFISETIKSALDLSLVYDSYQNATEAPFGPAMMTKLLLYGYSIGVTVRERWSGAVQQTLRFAGWRRTALRTTARSRGFAAGTWARSRICLLRCWCTASEPVWWGSDASLSTGPRFAPRRVDTGP